MSTFESSDFLPFLAGIKAGAPAVLVSHNIVNCMDSGAPASLSKEVHRILREELGFTGVIMTDDLAMQAIPSYTGGQDPSIMAFQAGNDILLTSDLEGGVAAVSYTHLQDFMDFKRSQCLMLYLLHLKGYCACAACQVNALTALSRL